jgi:hypothetical protein
MRVAGTAQTGQRTAVCVEVTCKVMRDALSSRCHASRRSKVISGKKGERKTVNLHVRCLLRKIKRLST